MGSDYKDKIYGKAARPQSCCDYTQEDKDPETEPVNFRNPAAIKRHFRPLPDSEKDLANAVKNCDKNAFERHAHQMQDFFAHYGQGYRAIRGGHGWDSVTGGYPEPDNADHYEDAFDQATERSDMWVNKWDECCCEKNGTPTQRKKEDGSPACQDVSVPENPYDDKAAPPKPEPPKNPEPPKKRIPYIDGFPSIYGFPLQLPPFDPGGIV